MVLMTFVPLSSYRQVTEFEKGTISKFYSIKNVIQVINYNFFSVQKNKFLIIKNIYLFNSFFFLFSGLTNLQKVKQYIITSKFSRKSSLASLWQSCFSSLQYMVSLLFEKDGGFSSIIFFAWRFVFASKCVSFYFAFLVLLQAVSVSTCSFVFNLCQFVLCFLCLISSRVCCICLFVNFTCLKRGFINSLEEVIFVRI